MGEFWKYFHEVLAWPQIHAPGPLQAVTRGAALALDEVRDDIVYFRRQFLPALCEPELVPAHGASRGIIRHPKETADQYRQRVVKAWRWHMLGGKVQGLPEILGFFGYPVTRIENSGLSLPSKWAEFQLELREPVTQEEQTLQLTGLDMLVWLVNEYKPARSVLSRIYHSGYDIRPLILDRRFGLDRNFLDGESGRYIPELGVVVSFGNRINSQALPLDRTPLVAWTESAACLVDYLTRYQLDRFKLDIPLLQPVTLATSPLECAEVEAVDHGHDLSRRVCRSLSKSQLVLDWSRLDGINSRLDRPHRVVVDNPWRVDGYTLDASIDRRVIPIHEFWHELTLHSAAPRPSTVPDVCGTTLAAGIIAFELHNPRHRQPRVDSLVLDSPRRERFDHAETHTFGDAAPAPQSPHHMAWTAGRGTVALSQLALDASRMDAGPRLDGDHVTVVLNPWSLDRYKLDDSVGRTTTPIAGLGVVRASLGVVIRQDAPTELLATAHHTLTLADGAARTPQATSTESAFILPASLPRFPRVCVMRLDGGMQGAPSALDATPQGDARRQERRRQDATAFAPLPILTPKHALRCDMGLDAAWLHGDPHAVAVSMNGAQALSMLAHRDDTAPPGIVAAQLVGIEDEARVSPALWASGWTLRPWIKNFAYLNNSEDV